MTERSDDPDRWASDRKMVVQHLNPLRHRTALLAAAPKIADPDAEYRVERQGPNGLLEVSAACHFPPGLPESQTVSSVPRRGPGLPSASPWAESRRVYLVVVGDTLRIPVARGRACTLNRDLLVE